MKRQLLVIALCIFVAAYSSAQQLTISGKITEKANGKPLPLALVTVRPTGGNKVVHFTQTSNDGSFVMKLPVFPENHSLQVSMMGFETVIIPLSAERRVYNISLAEKATELKEVIVKAPSIHERGDTITYIVSRFADAQDKTLADVLKKMPGIEVEKSGAIKYNGVSINKFYIEGKDMLGGRYGIATNNIHQKDVGSVEVMENHQPVKALQDISFSKNPAINIRLKEDAKARWVGTVKAGAGFTPLLWSGELALMRFKKKTQTFNTYKTNNIGKNITNENMSFSLDDLRASFSKNYRLQNYLSVSPDYLRAIDGNRSRFNTSHIVTTNNLWSLGKNYDLTTQISYVNHRQTADNYTHTSHFLNDSTIVTEATQSALSKLNNLYGNLTLTANTKNYYFNNKLFADMQWNDIDMQITGTFPNRQTASIPYQKISNDLEIIKRSETKAYTINTFNLYQRQPQHLTVTRNNTQQYQQVDASAFYSNTNTGLSFYWRPFMVSMKLGVVGLHRSLKTDLTGVSDTLGGLKNDVTMRYLNLFVSPEIEYQKSGLEAKFDMPVSFIPYQFSDKINHTKQHEEKFFISPRLFMRYQLTSRLSVSLSGKYAQSAVAEQSFYEGLILNNYRYLSRGLIDYSTASRLSANFDIRYRNPLKAFFINANIMRSRNYSPYISDQHFLDPYLLRATIVKKNRSDMWLAHGNISKGVDIFNGIISLNAMYNAFEGVAYQNGNASPYASESWNISPKITSRPATWCNLSYRLSFEKNHFRMKNAATRSSVQNFSQRLSCYFTPKKTWYLELSGEHYYNEITPDVSKHTLLADAEFTYSFKGGWEFNLSVKNIFDQRAYAYTLYNELTAVRKEYVIRPRNVLASVFFRF